MNSERTIRDAINSVLDQNHPSVEVLVIDGQSSDRTVDLLKEYGNRIFWISEPDKGQTDALIKGFRQVNGEILTWLNADDRLTSNALSAVDQAFRNDPLVEFVYGDIEFIDSTGRVLSWRLEPSFSRFILLYGHNLFADPTCFWKADVFDTTGELNSSINLSMDYEFWVRCCDRGIRFGQIESCLAQYRIDKENRSIAQFSAMREEHFNILTANRAWLRALPSALRKTVLNLLLKTSRLWKVVKTIAERGALPKRRFSSLSGTRNQ